MKFNYARPTLVYLLLFFWAGTVAMYFSQYTSTGMKGRPFVMVIIVLLIVALATLTHKTLTRTRYSLKGNMLTEYNEKGKELQTISIDSETHGRLRSDPNFRRRTICEIQKGSALISAHSDLHRWNDFLVEIRKLCPIESEEQRINSG